MVFMLVSVFFKEDGNQNAKAHQNREKFLPNIGQTIEKQKQFVSKKEKSADQLCNIGPTKKRFVQSMMINYI